jgi:hypothetical protein
LSVYRLPTEAPTNCLTRLAGKVMPGVFFLPDFEHDVSSAGPWSCLSGHVAHISEAISHPNLSRLSLTICANISPATISKFSPHQTTRDATVTMDRTSESILEKGLASSPMPANEDSPGALEKASDVSLLLYGLTTGLHYWKRAPPPGETKSRFDTVVGIIATVASGIGLAAMFLGEVVRIWQGKSAPGRRAE